MTKSATRIQDKDTQKRLSVVQSTEDPTKYWVVILNPDGSKIRWPKGEAATVTVGTTTTWNPWTSASVTNSWDTHDAVLNFTIPRWSNVSVGSTATGQPWTSASVTNSWTWWDVVLDFTIPEGIQWELWPTGNWISSVTSSKSWKTTTVTMDFTDPNMADFSFQVQDWLDWEGSWDVLWPNSATDWHLAVFDWATGKLIKDWWTVPVVPTIVDALNSQSATSTLSANQGYVLKWYVDTINWKISADASSSNKLVDKNYVDDSINSVTAYYITKNANGDQFATYAELSSASTFYSWWVARTPTRNDYCIVQADENHDNATTRYIYQWGQWEFQYVVNETALTQAQLDALNSGITSWKVTTYDWYATTISWKQDALTTQTAYSAKGTTTKVPQITTNTLWQVTTITEKNIAFPVTSVNWQTWDITWLQTALTTQTAYSSKWTSTKVPTITTNSLWQVTAITETSIDFPVTSVNGNNWAVTVNEVPTTWNVWDVLTKTADWYEFAAPTGSDYSWVTKTISWWEIELWIRTIVNIPWSDFLLTAPATLAEWEEYVIRIISEDSYTMTLGTGFTNPRNVDTSLSYYATDQFVFLAVWWVLELQPLVATWE